MNTSTDPRKGWTSASNAQSDRLCEGRHQAQRGLPDIPTEASLFGQHVHDALADSGNASLLSKLTSEERDMFDSHREVEKKLIQSIWNIQQHDNNTRVLRHERFWCKVPHQSLEMAGPKTFYSHSGEADYVMIRQWKILIQDYKSLAGDVAESSDNEQLRDLAVMVSRAYKCEEVYVAINQPLVTWSPKLCFYNKGDLERAEAEMWDRVRRSNQPNPPRTAGEIQCKFCKATSICREHAKWRSALAPEEVNPLKLSMSEWTVEQRVLVATHLPRLQKLLDDAKEFLKQKLRENPDSIPGFYLKDGATRHVINNPQELFNRFSTLGGQLEHFMKCIRVTKDELETQIRALTKTKGKGLKAEMDKILLGITDAKQNEPSLAKKEEA